MKRTYQDLATAFIDTNSLSNSEVGKAPTYDDCNLACYIDIARSLRAIRAALECKNTVKIPQHLQALESLAREFWVKPKRRRKRKPINT